MDWNRIENLLEKYYNAETTIAEEQELQTAFQGTDIPTHLQKEAKLFSFFDTARDVEMNENKIEPKQIQHKVKPQVWQTLLRYSTVAAVLLFGVFVFNEFKPTKNCITDGPVLAVINNQQICDEAIARKQAEEALEFIAAKLNKGTGELKNLEYLNTPQRITK